MANGTHSINSELIESEPEAHLRVEDLSMSNGLENGKFYYSYLKASIGCKFAAF